jgi:PAS domain S-box-containing protein
LRALSVRRSAWSWGSVLTLAAATVLLCLGLLNVVARATWNEVEDGVLWVSRPTGVVALDVARNSPAAAVGVRPGDLLVAIADRPVDQPSDVIDVLHQSDASTTLEYTLVHRGDQRFITVNLAPVPQGNRPLYFILAAIGMFTLLVGASVRLRRPSDQATLHFFWLCLSFFGMFAFSHSGRFDGLDWFFYWADAVSILMLPPLFLHFSLVFPERAPEWEPRRLGRIFLPVLYSLTAVLIVLRIFAVSHMNEDALSATRTIEALDRTEPLYLSFCLVGGLAIFLRAMGRVRSVTARRQLRWIVWGTALGAGPLALAYALPYAAGFDVPPALEFLFIPLSLLPLAFASAIVRYRLMDVEVIIKRSLMYAVMASAILLIYVILLKGVGLLFPGDLPQNNTIIAMLATLLVVLLAPPVKSAIQVGLDRMFYRDRYDYRRALVGFARDLNSDLDIDRLTERLVARIRETLVVDRIALMLDDDAGGFAPFRTVGVKQNMPGLARESVITDRLTAGHAVGLDDTQTARRFSPSEIAAWYDHGIHYFVPCVSKSGTIAVIALGRKEGGEPLSSEDVALLAAVAAQAATALENGRLYQSLHLKAQELDRLREFNESIVESLDEGLVVLDREERVLRWNRAMEQISGLTRAEVAGRSVEEVFDPLFLTALRNARDENPVAATLYRTPLVGRGTQDGRRLLVNATSVPLQQLGETTGVGPAVSGSLIMVENITERVQLEEQLQISDKMASVGLLAAGVAHEVNTPLTGISSFTQMLLDGADPGDPKTQLLEKIEQQTFRAAKIVSGLLNLSRPSQSVSEPAAVDVNVVITDVLALLDHQLAIGKIKLRRELCGTPAVVSGFEHKLQQVFLNLFLNARDAMPRGGWLSVTTRVDDGHVVAEVADTGSGIPNEHLSRIYDPFFTTKTIGKGTGLGLSITYGIVREHDGTLDCHSTVGQGTRFIVTVPHAKVDTRSTKVGN